MQSGQVAGSIPGRDAFGQLLWASRLHLFAFVNKQYNLAPA